jgi:putative surface-exposed virulence protein
MNSELRTRYISFLLFFILIASAAFTVPVRADSGLPPAPPSPSGQASKNTGATQNLSLVPSSGINIVSGHLGHKLELTGQSAAYVAQQSGDPIWCPSTVLVPMPGVGGCTSPGPANINYDPTKLDSLVAYLGNPSHQPGFNKNGTIWITGGADGSTGQISMDGSTNFSTMSGFSLTFKGGWTGIGATINTKIPSVISHTLFVDAWGKDITLSDVQFNNVTTGSGEGVFITTGGNITVSRVQANNDNGWGAALNAGIGPGIVKVSNSQFNNDNLTADPFALNIISLNSITLTNVLVDNGKGATIDNSTASNKPVTITSSRFDNNSNNGLTVTSTGAITVSNISASGNGPAGSYGASLDNHTGTAAPVTLIGMNTFDNNNGYGLYVYSKGIITSGSINASFNGATGTTLDNFTAASVLSSTLTGTGIFYNNGADGLDVYSQGAITVNNLTASGNSFGGAYLKNNYGFPSIVKVIGTNFFIDNKRTGLYIDSIGAISLNNITANGNGSAGAYDGLYAENNAAGTPQSITLTGASTFNKNTLSGANLLATGPIKLGKVTAIGNIGAGGVFVGNYYLGSTMPQSVTMLGPSLMTDNKFDNLVIYTWGAIVVQNLTANNSLAGYGAELGFSPYYAGNVTLTGSNTFNHNAFAGLVVLSRGAVVINGLTAGSNTGSGVSIINNAPTFSAPVTLLGVNNFNFNHSTGLNIYSNGTVLISGLNAASNTGEGVNIDNSTSTVSSSVTLMGINIFNYNGSDGLDIHTKGPVLTNGLNAINNIGNGVSIDNSTSTVSSPLTLSGLNNFNLNNLQGLNITSSGAVLTNNLNASNNGGNGVFIINTTSTSSPVTLKGVNNLNYNGGNGLDISANGTILLSGLTASNNFGNGANIFNGFSPASSPVTLNGAYTLDFNGGYGLNLYSKGVITVNNLTASDNGGAGAWLQNSYLGASGGISVKGKNIFFDNSGADGLVLHSNGLVTVTNISAKLNFDNGMLVDTTGNVTVTCGSFIGNGTSHTTGYGWETSINVSLIKLIGVATVGNFSGDGHILGATVVTNIPKTCILP